MYQVYQTGIGDTLEKIASKFNMTVDELKNINNTIPDVLMAGTLIVVPSSNNDFIKYIVQTGDTVYGIAKRYNVNVNTLLLINGLNENEYIYPGQIILIPKSNIGVYITREGNIIDDLVQLGSLDDILALNSKIYLLPGQVVLYKKEN